MKEIFKDILAIDGVSGILLFSHQGRVVFQELVLPLSENPERRDWKSLTTVIKDMNEVDFIYENSRIYIRNSTAGHLLVLMELFTSIAMVRLSCDMALPVLNKKDNGSRGIMSFFKW